MRPGGSELVVGEELCRDCSELRNQLSSVPGVSLEEFD
jgi:hypothetical protein